MPGRISGRVELKPIRLGLVVASGDSDSLRRAAEIASVCWGGSTFPIFESDEDRSVVQRTATMLGVDALVACDPDLGSVALAKIEGFEWMGMSSDSPVEFGAYGDRLVNLATVLSAARRRGRGEPPSLVAWDDRDHLALLFAVMYGHLADSSDYEQQVRDVVAAALPTVELPLDGEIAEGLGWTAGPLELGAWAVLHHGGHRDYGVAVVDPASTSDLVKLWNLRAAGNVALPWPEPFDERIAAITRDRLDALPLRKWGEDGDGFTTVFAPDQEVPATLQPLLDERPGTVLLSFMDLEAHSFLGAGIGSDFTSYFDVEVRRAPRGEVSARVPLPPTEMAADRPALSGFQYCAARVVINSEDGIGERLSFRCPALRRHARDLRFAVNITSPIVRGVGNGLVVACRIDENELSLGAIDSTALISRLLSDAGFKVTLSDAGRWTVRIVDMLGGAASTLAAQPAIREVLDLAAREGGAGVRALHQTARRTAGHWPGSVMLWLRQPYPHWVVGVLAAQRIIEAHLVYTCPACGLSQSMAPEQIQPILTCNDCDEKSPLSLQVVVGAQWRLKTRRLLTRKRLRSALPISATLALFCQVEREPTNLHYALGLELEREGVRFEIDYAVLLQDERGPVLIVGESKARQDLVPDEIAKLEDVQDAVRSLGVESFIAVSNSKMEMADGEVARLRESAERFYFGLNEDRGRGSYVNLPIILTKDSLTVPDTDGTHPLRAIGHHRFAVDELARWTAEQNLGLDGYGDPLTRTLAWKPTGTSSSDDPWRARKEDVGDAE